MKHKVKVTALDTKLYTEYQQQLCANPCSGKCPVYNKGDVFEFYRDENRGAASSKNTFSSNRLTRHSASRK